MCGIAGFIGVSKRPEVTYAIVTKIFDMLELRGVDAAGYWGCERDNGKIFYHKEPIKSSELIQKEVWKEIGDHNPNLLIMHARAASIGVGINTTNKNNHPFVSRDKKTALVHNGRIQDSELDILKKKYETFSKTDSEMLLRIFEHGSVSDKSKLDWLDLENDTNEVDLNRMSGLKDIFSHVTKGHMAVAIGEYFNNGDRKLWLFRNKHRPLWLIDLRKQLGQIFFISTIEIWQEAVRICPEIQPLLRKKVKLIELPTEQIWSLKISNTEPIVQDHILRKYDVNISGTEQFDHKGTILKLKDGKPDVEVVSRLDENELIVTEKANKKNKNKQQSQKDLNEDDAPDAETSTVVQNKAEKLNNDASSSELDQIHQQITEKCNKLSTLLETVESLVKAKVDEKTITKANSNEILQHLDGLDAELTNGLKELDG